MNEHGWKRLVEGWPWFRGEGRYPVQPNSEFMGPLRRLRKPYGCWGRMHVDEGAPLGWPVTEYEEALGLRPGLHCLGRRLLGELTRLARGEPGHDFGEYKL